MQSEIDQEKSHPKRAIVWLALLASAITLGPTCFAKKVRQQTNSDLIRAVVQVEAGSNLGSGFFISPNGTVITNEHVIANHKTASVILSDGRRFLGKVEASDSKLDLAAIKVELLNTPYLSLGDTTEPKAGTSVLLAGSPEGLSSSLVRASIAAKARKIDDRVLIQLDGDVNHGLSGGPVLLANDDVVGVVVSRLEEAQGIGFAIPVSDLYAFLEKSNISAVSSDVKHQSIDQNSRTQAPSSGSVSLGNLPPRWISIIVVAAILMLISALIFWRAIASRKPGATRPKLRAVQMSKETYEDVDITLKESRK